MAQGSEDARLYESLHAGGHISSVELRHLLGQRPGALSRSLAREFVERVGALRSRDLSDVELRGFIISAPSHFESVFLIARPSLEALVGPVSMAVLSPSPTEARFALPVAVPRSVRTARDLRMAAFATVHATLLNLEMFGGAPARFLLAHSVHVQGAAEFFQLGEPALTGADVLGLLQERLNLDYPEVRLALLAHLFSSPPYLERVGGTGLSLMACEDRHRCLSKRALADVLRDLRLALPPYMTGRRHSSHMDYMGIRPVPLRFGRGSLHWMFNRGEGEAATFLSTRQREAEALELSVSTRAILETREFERDIKEMLSEPSERQVVMSVSDLPVLLGTDDVSRDEAVLELHQASEDVAHAVMGAVALHPTTVLEVQDRPMLVERILREIHRDWPEMEACMKREVVFNLSAQGGLIEHATRATGAVARACSQEAEAAARRVQDMFVSLFARFYDILEPQLRQYFAVLDKRERMLADRLERQVLDAFESAFLVLDAEYPDGWPYPEFERLVLPRVSIGGRAGLRRRFELVRAEGEVVEVSPGVFRRVWGAGLFS